MIYNFNLGIGWASSGVEYAQSYRANILRKLNKKTKFVFTDMILNENIEHLTDNIGFKDTEVIWMYEYFTDFKIAPTTYKLSDLEDSFGEREFTFSREGKISKYVFENEKNFYRAYMVDETSDKVQRVEIVSNGCLVRKDYFSYGRVLSEYYAPLNGSAHLYQRRFFNVDGTIAFEEIIDGDSLLYRMKDKILYSKEELVSYFVKSLNLTANDLVVVDRASDIGQAILMNAKPARIAVVVHAEHFSESNSNEDNILWNNFYEYTFDNYKEVDFYITATDAQNILLKEQFMKYFNASVRVITIPVGSIDNLKYPDLKRNKYSLITASRLANEKHIDYLIKAVSKVHEKLENISLDIYGEGANKKELEKLISELGANNYIRLMGQQDLANVYQKYEAYVSASMSEGFGLTLLEAVGAGLPIIGFDVRYGNQTFIEDGYNGYLLPVDDMMDEKDKVIALSDAIIKLMENDDLSDMHKYSYEIAKKYLTKEVLKKWENVLDR